MKKADFYRKVKAPKGVTIEIEAVRIDAATLAPSIPWMSYRDNTLILPLIKIRYRDAFLESTLDTWMNFTVLTVASKTESLYTKANADMLAGKISNYLPLWRQETRFFKALFSEEIKHAKKKNEILSMAKTAGVDDDGKLGYARGDHHQVRVEQFLDKKADLKKYHASGKYLALVNQERKRVYAKSSKWGPSTRNFKFLVGQNENGNPFAHQVPESITTIGQAWRWIWNDNTILDRQGDIGVAPSTLKHKDGQTDDIDVAGHSRHRFKGEVYQNGAIHIRRGTLYHEGGQHPAIEIGDEWRRVVVARRSRIGMSSRD